MVPFYRIFLQMARQSNNVEFGDVGNAWPVTTSCSRLLALVDDGFEVYEEKIFVFIITLYGYA